MNEIKKSTKVTKYQLRIEFYNMRAAENCKNTLRELGYSQIHIKEVFK